MLLFILHTIKQEYQSQYFNTSHVTVYPFYLSVYTIQYCYFNTSHVTVYPLLVLMLALVIADFNTSHVTVYPEGEKTMANMNLFQYISCYCLSTHLCV